MKNISSFNEFKILKEAREFTNDATWKNSLIGKGVAGLFVGASALIKAIFGRTLNGYAKRIDNEHLKGVILWCISNNVNIVTGEITRVDVPSGDEDAHAATPKSTATTAAPKGADYSKIIATLSDENKKNYADFLTNMDNLTKDDVIKRHEHPSKSLIVTTDQQYDNLIADNNKTISGKNASIKKLETELSNKSADIKNKNGDLPTLKAEIDKLEEKREAIKKEIKNISDENTIYGILKTEVPKLLNRLNLSLDKDGKLVDSTNSNPAEKSIAPTDTKPTVNTGSIPETEEEYKTRIGEGLQLNVSDIFIDDEDPAEAYLTESLSVKKLFYRHNLAARTKNIINKFTNFNLGNNVNLNKIREDLPEDVQKVTIDKINLVQIAKAMVEIDGVKPAESSTAKTLYSKDMASQLVDVNKIYQYQLSAELVYSDEDGRPNKKGENTWKIKLAAIRSKYKDVLIVDKLDPTSSSFMLNSSEKTTIANDNKGILGQVKNVEETKVTLQRTVESFGLDPEPFSGEMLSKYTGNDPFMMAINWDGYGKTSKFYSTSMAIRPYAISEDIIAFAIVNTFDKNFLDTYSMSNTGVKNVGNDIFLKFIFGNNHPAKASSKVAYLVFRKLKLPITDNSDTIESTVHLFSMAGDLLYSSSLSKNATDNAGGSISIDTILSTPIKANFDANTLRVVLHKIYKFDFVKNPDIKKNIGNVKGDEIKKVAPKLVEYFNKYDETRKKSK